MDTPNLALLIILAPKVVVRCRALHDASVHHRYTLENPSGVRPTVISLKRHVLGQKCPRTASQQ